MTFSGKAFWGVKTWMGTWKAMGQTKGIVDYLSDASVSDVKHFIKEVASCNRGQTGMEKREEAVENLFRALAPTQFQDGDRIGEVRSKDPRPLQHIYIQLVPACSDNFVIGWMKRADIQLAAKIRFTRVLRAHGSALRREIDSAMLRNIPVEHPWLVSAFRAFAAHEPNLPGDQPRFSASMDYSEKVLRWRLKNLESRGWPKGVDELEIYGALLNRCVRKKVSTEKLHSIVALGLELVAAKGKSAVVTIKLWAIITKWWRREPGQWDDNMAHALRLGLAGSPKTIGNNFLAFPALQYVDEVRRWELFRLYNLHIPQEGGDVNITSHAEKFTNQQYSRAVFENFSTQHSITLLRNLIGANTGWNILSHPNGNTILSMPKIAGKSDFDAVLFLRYLQSTSDNPVERTESREWTSETVADLQRKSAASREQAQRAELAKAACFAAIASNSLDLYASTIQWLERYVRDPLSPKTLFNAQAVATTEGIALLSGVPPEGTTNVDLATISANVSKANAILGIFRQHMLLAKREPSFQVYDWKAVSALFNQVMTERVKRAKAHQKSLQASDGDMYSSIWSQSFAMMTQVGADSLQQAQWQVRSVISDLGPDVLLTVARSLLETDDTYRKANAKEGDAVTESRIIENLAYHAIICLANSKQPALAKELIVRTIIDRPDASSWHRQLLTIGYMKRLPRRDAEEILFQFAEAIGEKLQEQSYVKIGEKVGSPPLIKVTTVKYLAQMLQGAEFLSAEATVNVLVELFRSASHIDVRIAVLESLTSSLIDGRDIRSLKFTKDTQKCQDTQVEKILVALETLIPIAGSINERRPPTEQEWKDAEVDPTKLPDVIPTSASALPPLLESLFVFVVQRLANSNFAELQQVLVKRILLPTLVHSKQEHRRWLRIFLLKHKMTCQLPDIPVSPALTLRLFTIAPHLLLQDDLRSLDHYAKFVLSMPVECKIFTARLSREAKKKEQPDMNHWLELVDRTALSAVRTFTHQLILTLTHGLKPSLYPTGIGITKVDLQVILFSHLELLLNKYDHSMHEWDQMMVRLEPPSVSAKVYNAWLLDVLPVTQQVAAAIDSKRSDPAWRQSIDRKPAILPSSGRLRLWEALCPLLDSQDSAEKDKGNQLSASQCKRLASRILAFVDAQLDLPGDGVQTEEVESDVLSFLTKIDPPDQLSVACCLGEAVADRQSQDPLSGVELHLLVQIVHKAIGRAGSKPFNGKKVLETDLVLAGRIHRLVDGWLASEHEGIRRIAVKLRQESGDLWKPRREDKSGKE